MKRVVFSIVALTLLSVLTINAESTVYLFLRELGNCQTSVSINGKQITHMDAPIKKTMNDNMFKMPLKVAKKCSRKFVFNKEGKTVIGFEMVASNVMTGKKSTMKAETTLDLVDGETYYVDITNKGLNDVQLKILDEKKGKKKLDDKKAVVLEEVTLK